MPAVNAIHHEHIPMPNPPSVSALAVELLITPEHRKRARKSMENRETVALKPARFSTRIKELLGDIRF